MIVSIMSCDIGTGTSPPSGLATGDGAQGGPPSNVAPLWPPCQSCWKIFMPCGAQAASNLLVAFVQRGIEHVERGKAGRMDRQYFKDRKPDPAPRAPFVIGDQIVVHQPVADPRGMGCPHDPVRYLLTRDADRCEDPGQSHRQSRSWSSLISALPMFPPPSMLQNNSGMLASPSAIVSCHTSWPERTSPASSARISAAPP